MYILYTYRRKATVASSCPPSPYIVFSMTSEKTLQGLLSSGGVCGWMSRCGCERVSVQQLPVQVSSRFCSAEEARSCFLFPERIRPVCRGITLVTGRARNAGKRLSKSESDLHISPYLAFRPSSRFFASFVCVSFFFYYYYSCRGRKDFFIRLFRLPPVEEVFTQRLEDQLLSSCQSGQASAR